MCRLFNSKFSAFLLSLLLVVSFMVGFPGRAEAAKVAKAIAFDPGATVINVAAIYETAPTTQKSTLKSLKSMKTMKKAPGYSGSALLKSEDGTRIIALSQWTDLASYQAFMAPPEAAQETEKKSKAPPATPLKTIVFEVGKTQSAREGIIPTVKGKEAVVEFSDFTLKNAGDKDKVVAGAEKLIPAALLKQPTPRSVILLSSADSPEVALMANWNCTADFEAGEKPGAIDAPDAEIAALVDVDSHLYDVVSILPAEVKKPEKTEES